MKHRLLAKILCGLTLFPFLSGYIAANSKDEGQHLRDVYLTTPNLSTENILSYKVGIRPYRKSGIRIEPVFLQSKLLVHNYGYGGSGLTLCWGGAQEVINILTREKNENAYYATVKKVAVLGAGVIGLATAYDLLDQGYDVTIYASDFSPNLTSNIAGGIWSPPAVPDTFTAEKKSMYERLLEVATKRFVDCIDTANPEFAGISTIIGYYFKVDQDSHTVTGGKFKSQSDDKELVNVHFDNGVSKVCRTFKLISTDGKLFMDDLSEKVLAKGGQIVQQHFHTLEDVIALDESIIINCTSFGSRTLFDDQELEGARGQMVDFKPQTGVDYLFSQNVPNTNYWVVINPWSDRLTLGGVFEDGEEKCTIDQSVIDKILQNGRNSISQ